jgi:hypothetical protein
MNRPAPFKPENPFVVVCEGFQDAGFICALLRQLKVGNCDVTFPKKKRDLSNGKEGIPEMVRLLSEDPVVEGIAIVRDADDDSEGSFQEACKAFVEPFNAPKECFTIERGKRKTTAVFVMPGKGQTGALEHLLLKAVFSSYPELDTCMNNLVVCTQKAAKWSENKQAKMKMQCVIAAFCQDDPGCSLGFIWEKGRHNPIDIASPDFHEFAEFLISFTAAPAQPRTS